ncbi:hypothetical protein FQK07_10275 [Synechococcus sp. BSF8S]|uniref:hypothetical protein n=1 Tax=Synechococcales TaxID=1890424 RepID=UPI001627BD63|nr:MULTISPECIES: hypothetical protein [unclassified Synechococcus]MBC1261640.1 hypothetical protein [Synechococcus sp. BSF8S]MBC1264569.1 hypothetical protein [Synechococcus sp. BSA11S]
MSDLFVQILRLCQKVEILDAQEDRRYGKGNRGSDLPDELRRRQDRLARIRQARQEMEAETAAATARRRQEEAEEAMDKATAAREAAAAAADLNPLAADAMPRRGLARKTDGTPTKPTLRSFTDPESHLMTTDGHVIQG